MWYAALLGGLLEAMGSFVGKALISAGVSYVAYRLMDVSVQWALDQFFLSAGGLPAAATQALGLMEVDTFVEMCVSAVVLRLTFKGMSGGVMKAAKLG